MADGVFGHTRNYVWDGSRNSLRMSIVPLLFLDAFCLSAVTQHPSLLFAVDGRTSEDSAVDVGDEEQVVETLIGRGELNWNSHNSL